MCLVIQSQRGSTIIVFPYVEKVGQIFRSQQTIFLTVQVEKALLRRQASTVSNVFKIIRSRQHVQRVLCLSQVCVPKSYLVHADAEVLRSNEHGISNLSDQGCVRSSARKNLLA